MRWPLPWRRMIGRTALVTRTVPKNTASAWARKSSMATSSMGEMLAWPALFTTTSIRPNCSAVRAMAFSACAAPVTSSVTGRTRSPYLSTEQRKQQRAEDLLAAARRLALDEGVRAVTLTEIANVAGVHVSAVRRYFESREEIFLRRADEGWTEWAQAVRRQVGTGRPLTPRALATTLADTLSERPLFGDLLAHAPLSLERAVSAASPTPTLTWCGASGVTSVVAGYRRGLAEVREGKGAVVCAGTPAGAATSIIAWRSRPGPPARETCTRRAAGTTWPNTPVHRRGGLRYFAPRRADARRDRRYNRGSAVGPIPTVIPAGIASR